MAVRLLFPSYIHPILSLTIPFSFQDSSHFGGNQTSEPSLPSLPAEGRGGRTIPMYRTIESSPRGLLTQSASVRISSTLLPLPGAHEVAIRTDSVDDRSAFSEALVQPAPVPALSRPLPPKKSVSFTVPDDLFSEVDCAAALLAQESNDGLDEDQHDYARTLAGACPVLLLHLEQSNSFSIS